MQRIYILYQSRIVAGITPLGCCRLCCLSCRLGLRSRTFHLLLLSILVLLGTCRWRQVSRPVSLACCCALTARLVLFLSCGLCRWPWMEVDVCWSTRRWGQGRFSIVLGGFYCLEEGWLRWRSNRLVVIFANSALEVVWIIFATYCSL